MFHHSSPHSLIVPIVPPSSQQYLKHTLTYTKGQSGWHQLQHVKNNINENIKKLDQHLWIRYSDYHILHHCIVTMVTLFLLLHLHSNGRFINCINIWNPKSSRPGEVCWSPDWNPRSWLLVDFSSLGNAKKIGRNFLDHADQSRAIHADSSSGVGRSVFPEAVRSGKKQQKLFNGQEQWW